MSKNKSVKIFVSSNGRATVDVRTYINSKNVQAQVKKMKELSIKR